MTDASSAATHYPDSAQGDVVETLHGHEIADPYRWLEDPDSAATRDWVARQNAFTEHVFAGIPERDAFQRLLAGIVRRPTAGIPVVLGGQYFVFRNDGTQSQAVLYTAPSLAELRAGGRVALDPNGWSADGTASLRGFTVSGDGRYLAYQRSEGGSDWSDVIVIELATGEAVDEPIQTRFTYAFWLPDHRSFLYAAVPHSGRGSGDQAQQVKTGMIKLHRLGTPESADETVLDVREEYRQGFAIPHVSSDRGLVAVHLVEGTENDNRLWFFRVEAGAGAGAGSDGTSTLSAPLKVFDTAEHSFWFIRNDGDLVYLLTDAGADRRRVVAVDLAAFERSGIAALIEVIPETADALVDVLPAGDELIAVRLVDAQPALTRHAVDGTVLGAVEVPAGGALAGSWADPEHAEWFFGLSTPTAPTRAFRVTAGTGHPEALDDLVPTAAGDSAAFVPPATTTERRRAVSADGTEVPYFLITPDAAPAGPRPTLLYGYGGFDIAVTADYRPMWAGWLAAGGTLAIANLRGGGEFGRAWYDDGRREHKQNVFDDFIAIGEQLVASGVTTSAQLTIHGRSNGGLLVGAVMTQRPELAAVALPMVGVLDMLRFHRFTAGAAWTSDYGDPDVATDFETALAYSPLHGVRPVRYPATLVCTGDHDDRVVPAHSHKFTAALQAAQRVPLPDAPIVARIETQTGHGMGKPVAMVAAEAADQLAFAAHFTGLRPA